MQPLSVLSVLWQPNTLRKSIMVPAEKIYSRYYAEVSLPHTKNAPFMLLALHIYNVQHLIKSLHRHEVMSFSLATMSFLLTGYVLGHNGDVHYQRELEHECLWCLRKLRQLYNTLRAVCKKFLRFTC